MSLQCEITDDGRVYLKGENKESGRHFVKTISLQEFSSIIRDTNSIQKSPSLPRGCVQWGTNGNHHLVAVEFPAQRVEFRHVDYGPVEIPVPASVWFVLLTANGDGRYTIQKTYPFIYDMLLTEESPLYIWPFPNYSLTYGAGVCWGYNGYVPSNRDRFTMADVEMMFHCFFAADANEDLGWSFGGDFENGKKFITAISNLPELPMEHLRRYGSSFRETFDYILQNLSVRA